jgi:HD domain
LKLDDPVLVAEARGLAKKLLRKGLPERWLHTQGVAHRAAELAVTVPSGDRSLLIAAAWVHDIGYAPSVQETGFHPLDGGLYLRGADWDDRLAALVAHHSGARFVPAERGFDSLIADFDFEDDAVSDALTYADQTVGPNGRRMTVPYRIAEAIARHGPDSPNARARVDRVPYLLAVADRVERRMAETRRR